MKVFTGIVTRMVAVAAVTGALFAPVSAGAENRVARAGPSVRLFQNHPNPFNPRTMIPFRVNRTTRVTLAVYSENGRYVATLVDRDLAPGSYRATWDGRDENGKPVRAGLYYYRLRADRTFDEGRAIVLK